MSVLVLHSASQAAQVPPKPTAASHSLHPIYMHPPSPRCPARSQLTAFASILSSAWNSRLPLVYQTDPADPLSLNSDTLPSGSSSRIAQAVLGASSPGPLTQRRRHTEKSTTAVVSSVIEYIHAKPLQSCPTLCNPKGCSPPGSSIHGILQAKNTGVGGHALLQGIFPKQRMNVSSIGRRVLYL